MKTGYFAEAVPADGPWEARFRFCAKYGYGPEQVEVSPSLRVKGGEYWCFVGSPRNGFNPWLVFRHLDHLGRAPSR